MKTNEDGSIVIPVDFNNKNKMVKITFITCDGGGFMLKVGRGKNVKNFPLSDSSQVAEIINGVGTEAMEALTTMMKDAKVGQAFTLMCQLREQPISIIPGLGFIDEESPEGFYGGGGRNYWDRLMNNWFMLFNIDSATASRYKPNKQGFLDFQNDVKSNAINVDKNIINSVFGQAFQNPEDQFTFESDEEERIGDGKVKVTHPSENRTKLT